MRGQCQKTAAGRPSPSPEWERGFRIFDERADGAERREKVSWCRFETLEETRSKGMLPVPTMVMVPWAYLCSIDVCEVTPLVIAARSAQCLVLAIKLLQEEIADGLKQHLCGTNTDIVIEGRWEKDILLHSLDGTQREGSATIYLV